MDKKMEKAAFILNSYVRDKRVSEVCTEFVEYDFV